MATNNSINIASQGTVYYNGTGTFSGVDGSTAGKVLTSNGTGVAPSFQASSASGAVTTIDGDSGSATPSSGVITFDAVSQAGSSVSFSATSSKVTLNTSDINGNTIVGYLAGNSSISGSLNGGFGQDSLHALTSGLGNFGGGYSTLSGLMSGSDNTAVGRSAANGITTGSYGLYLGFNTGSTLSSSESSNIYLLNSGVNAESNTIRIGTQGTGIGQQSTCYIAGIEGVTVSNPSVTTVNTSTGQLGNDTTNFTILSTGLQLKGNNTNTAPPAGTIGEQIRAYNGSGTSLTSTVIGNITSIVLSAGIWDISAVSYISFSIAMTTCTLGLGTANNTFLNAGGDNLVQFNMAASLISPSIPAYRVLLSGSTTYYLNAQAVFASGTGTAYGRISATRVG